MKPIYITLYITGTLTLILGRIGHDNYPMLWLAGLQIISAFLLHLHEVKEAE